ncbi:hypothetical protein LINPERHAP2_LOCUS11947 [Linum perenne]
MGRKKAVDDSADGDGRRSYFPWNDELDQLLVKSILAIADDNKVDAKGKFANGAHTLLERLMLHEKPNCGVKASPNIVSRCKTLKAKFLAVQELRGLSGAGWDDVKKAVDIEDTSYAEYVEKHPHCAKLNRVPFPCYDGLEKVFGKIRATGKGATGLEELDRPVPNIEVPVNMQLGWKRSGSGENQSPPTDPEEQAHNDDRVGGDDEPNPPTPSDKATQPKANQSSASSRRKRTRQSSNDDDSDIAELKPVIMKIAASLESMIGEADTMSKRRTTLHSELGKIEGLTREQVFDATLALGRDVGILEIFYSLEEYDRKGFIERLLR